MRVVEPWATAPSTGVFRLVLTQGLRLAGVAILGGIAASLALGRFLASMLCGMRNGDPATLLTVAAMLAIATTLACAMPVWRAARVAPEATLRKD